MAWQDGIVVDTGGMDAMSKSIVAVVGTVVVLAIAYFAYDLLKPVVAPCETIYRQTKTSLGSKIEILKVRGEVFVGEEKLQDLTERAQVTAANLQTCCIALNSGAVSSDQFLQCQRTAGDYEREIETAAVHAGEAQAAQQQGQPDLVAAKIREINESLAAAAQRSVQLEQTLTRLTLQPAAQSTEVQALQGSIPAVGAAAGQQAQNAAGGEGEPNNDPQHARPIALDAWIDSAIGDANDDDFFKLRTAAANRDIYRIDVENKSTSWSPKLTLLDAKKSTLTSAANGNAGADLSLSFSGAADADYYVVVGRYHPSAGDYRLRISTLRAFDRYEPNDTIIEATSIGAGEAVSAGIMDQVDSDYYRVAAPAGIARMLVTLENRSTTLAPSVYLYNGRKSEIYRTSDGTPGANLEFAQDVSPSPHYYVLVDKAHNSAGDYTLTIRFE